MHIVYWSDYACPFCHIGITRMHKALDALSLDEPVDIEMRAYELDANAPRENPSTIAERLMKKYGLSADEANARIERLSKLGRAEGLDFNFGTALNANTLDAHRITKLAHDHGITDIESRLYQAYFGDNENVADHAVLRRIALESGLDADEVDRVLASGEYADAVHADEEEAHARGVERVPYYLIDGEYEIDGCFPQDNYERIILKALEKKRAAAQEATATETRTFEGEACGPDGCVVPWAR